MQANNIRCISKTEKFSTLFRTNGHEFKEIFYYRLIASDT